MNESPKAEQSVYDFLERTKYKWSAEMREISGFGGGYEATCRAMVSAGMEWFEKNPNADPKFHGFEGITGIIDEDNEDAKQLTKAVIAASAGDCTGAMHQFSIGHVLMAKKLGWENYVKKSIKAKDKERDLDHH
jgi:hypothetical protein